MTTWRIGVAAVLLGVVAVLGLAAATRGGEPDQEASLVYLSGLDDHLLETYDTVPMHGAPGGPVSHDAPASSLAWIHDVAGEWLYLELAQGDPVRGWVADFYLRGELHVVDPAAPGCPVPASMEPGGTPQPPLAPSTRVRLVDVANDGAWVLVRSLRTDTAAWVPREALSEQPGPDARRTTAGTACADIRPEPVLPHDH